MTQVILAILMWGLASAAGAVVLSKEVRVEGKVLTRCIIDTQKLSVRKSANLIDEVGELTDTNVTEVVQSTGHIEKEPQVKTKEPLLASASGREVYVTVEDKKKVQLSGQDRATKSPFVRVGPNSTKILAFIERNCQ